MSVVLLDEAIVHYEVLGKGRPVIFLHSWIGSWQYWISAMQVASTSFRAYALDLWGFGDTTHKTTHYTIDQQVALLRAFLKEMGIGKVALVGHGLGALVALDYTSKYSDEVDRIMAINCPVKSGMLHEKMRKISTIAGLVEWISGSAPNVQAALGDATKADLSAIATTVNGGRAGEIFTKANRQHTPCLLVNGRNDPAVSVPDIHQISDFSHLSHQIVLEKSGHFPMIDDAAKFNRLLTDFLALDSGLSPSELQLKDEWRRRVR